MSSRTPIDSFRHVTSVVKYLNRLSASLDGVPVLFIMHSQTLLACKTNNTEVYTGDFT